MIPLRIFISSVQGEFASERAALRDYVRDDVLMRRFFDVFLFEDAPASDRRPDQLYLDEVERCDVYVGLFGNDYGTEDGEGVSPTEREFDHATGVGLYRLVFVKDAGGGRRYPKMRALIGKAQAGLVRKRFGTTAELVAGLYAALVEYLESRELIRCGPFDAAPCAGAGADDLDTEKMAQFIRAARHARQFPLPEGTRPLQLLEHLNLLNDGRLTNAAVLLFGRTPQRFLISSEVRCAHFHGTEVAKPIPSYQVYKGAAFELVDQAVDFVLSKINRSIGTRAEGARARRTYEVPPEVVTEAIVNAVAHRDYTDNGSVQVMLFSDRLEVRNPGRLPPPLTLEGLREAHRSVPGNPLLAESLYLGEYIERMGTGTLDMIRRCVGAGLPEPEFAVTGGFVTTIRRAAGRDRADEGVRGPVSKRPGGWPRPPAGAGAVHDQVEPYGGVREGIRERREHQPLVDGSRVGGQAGVQVGVQVEVDAIDVAMLRACVEVAATSRELRHAGGYAGRTRSFERRITRLRSAGLIEMTVPDKPRSSAQRYRLSDKGRAAVAAAEARHREPGE